MERILRITEIHMPDLLDLGAFAPLFSPEGHGWQWCVGDGIEVNGLKASWMLNVQELERQATHGHRGLLVSFEDLIQLGRCVFQLIWGEFLAAPHEAALPRKSLSGAEAAQQATAGMSVVDSTFWLIGGPAAVVRRFEDRFPTEVIEPEDWVRGD